MHSFEGRKGVENLCKIAGALGYKDSLRTMSLRNGSCVGDLLAMLEDNPGLISTIIGWIQTKDFSEFRDPLERLVNDRFDGADDSFGF